MRHTLLTATAIAAVAATMTTVHAAPAAVNTGRVAQTRLTVPAGHGHVLTLDVRAAALSGGDVLRVVAERCAADGSCDELDAYQSALPAGRLTVGPDTTTAVLTTTLDGHDVVIHWRPTGATAPGTSGGGDFEIDDAGNASADSYQGQAAAVTVDIDGATCHGTGAVGSAVVADTTAVTGIDGAQPVAALRLPAGATIACG